jgi:hypothetical protein
MGWVLLPLAPMPSHHLQLRGWAWMGNDGYLDEWIKCAWLYSASIFLRQATCQHRSKIFSAWNLETVYYIPSAVRLEFQVVKSVFKHTWPWIGRNYYCLLLTFLLLLILFKDLKNEKKKEIFKMRIYRFLYWLFSFCFCLSFTLFLYHSHLE